jgi:hypothetical protein
LDESLEPLPASYHVLQLTVTSHRIDKKLPNVFSELKSECVARPVHQSLIIVSWVLHSALNGVTKSQKLTTRLRV